MEPLWQVAHVPGAIPAWVKVAGFHAVGRWQASHAAVVGIWVAGLPAACVELWQVAQEPGATPVCEKVAGFQAAVRWQESQDAPVVTCPPGLPVARLPSWQEAQLPGATAVWVKRAGVQAVARWQVSQGACVETWFGPLDVTESRPPGAWHVAQSRGVPRKTPCTWHDSQRTDWWAPESANPVVTWSKPRGAPCAAASMASSSPAAAKLASLAMPRADRSKAFIAHLPVSRSWNPPPGRCRARAPWGKTAPPLPGRVRHCCGIFSRSRAI